MAILSVEIDLRMLDQALGGKGLVADFNDPKKKVVLAAEGSDVTDAQIIAMAESLEASVIADRKAKELADKQKDAKRSALLERLGITEDEAKLLLG
jgi:hypothetical protein